MANIIKINGKNIKDVKASQDITDLRAAVAYSQYDNVKNIGGALCENSNTTFEQGTFTSTNPSVDNPYIIRSTDYFNGGVYIVNPNQSMYWAIIEFASDNTFIRYVVGNVTSDAANQYKDELFWLPKPNTYGNKYRIRVRYAETNKNITPLDNRIGIYKPLGQIYSYNRNYTDITGLLTFERKSIGEVSGITDSTTRLIAKLPNVGNIEVRMNTPNCRFAIFVEDNSGETPTYTPVSFNGSPWTWYYYRYTGNPDYNYYVLTRFETESTIYPESGGKNVKVYTYDDSGVGLSSYNQWYGKTIAVFGDSVVQGRFRKNGTNSTNALMPKPFPVLLAEMSNTEPSDYGIGGADVYGSAWNTLYTKRGFVTGYDVVLVSGGTNDFGDNISENDFKNAYASVLNTLKLNNTIVYAVTPVARETNAQNASGYYLSDYASWIREVAGNNSVGVVDLYTLTESNNVFKSNLSDGIHPNEVGQRIIADLILNNIP